MTQGVARVISQNSLVGEKVGLQSLGGVLILALVNVEVLVSPVVGAV